MCCLLPHQVTGVWCFHVSALTPFVWNLCVGMCKVDNIVHLAHTTFQHWALQILGHIRTNLAADPPGPFGWMNLARNFRCDQIIWDGS